MSDVEENRVRRALERQGRMLIKIVRRDTKAPGHGLYIVINPHRDPVPLKEIERRYEIVRERQLKAGLES